MAAVYSDRFNHTIRYFLKRPVFERSGSEWIDVLPTKTKQVNNRAHLSAKLTSYEASLKTNEGYVYKNLLDKGKKLNTKFQVNDDVRKTGLKETFSKGDTNKWSYKLCRITEIVKGR